MNLEKALILMKNINNKCMITYYKTFKNENDTIIIHETQSQDNCIKMNIIHTKFDYINAEDYIELFDLNENIIINEKFNEYDYSFPIINYRHESTCKVNNIKFTDKYMIIFNHDGYMYIYDFVTVKLLGKSCGNNDNLYENDWIHKLLPSEYQCLANNVVMIKLDLNIDDVNIELYNYSHMIIKHDREIQIYIHIECVDELEYMNDHVIS